MIGNQRVALAPQHPGHAEGLFACLQDPRIYAFLDGDPPRSVEDVREQIERLMAGGPPDGSEIWLNWTVFLGDGIVGSTQATILKTGSASIAYVLSPTVWGQGVAQTAAELTMAELAANHGISHLLADTETGNLPSQRLLRRLEFRRTHREGHDVFYARDI
jgi:RimJ/RimL family protein N-acetyltransferase